MVSVSDPVSFFCVFLGSDLPILKFEKDFLKHNQCRDKKGDVKLCDLIQQIEFTPAYSSL